MPEQFFWIISSCDGRPILIFGDRDENVARQKGLEQLNGRDFKLKRLPTRDLGKASSMIRGQRLEETHDLHEATKRQTHERGLRRHQQSQNQQNQQYDNPYGGNQ